MGCLLQLAATLVYALVANDLFAVMQSALFAVLCALVQCGLALIKPGALGFGDVTMTLMMGLAVGMTGLTGVVWSGCCCGDGSIGRGTPPMRARCRSRR